MRRFLVQMCAAIALVQPASQLALADGWKSAAVLAGEGGPAAQAPVLALGRIPPDVFDRGTTSAETRSTASDNATVRHCRVTSVHDGDSMRVRCPGFKDTLRIRMDQIDAPELDQAYGTRSRDALRSFCPKGEPAVVHDLGADTYDRRLARVFCNGVDVNAAMVSAGAAWVYDYHAADNSLYPLQDAARAQKRGLWAGPKKPLEPWEFRHRQRTR